MLSSTSTRSHKHTDSVNTQKLLRAARIPTCGTAHALWLAHLSALRSPHHVCSSVGSRLQVLKMPYTAHIAPLLQLEARLICRRLSSQTQMGGGV
jgi:hypothetical protein